MWDFGAPSSFARRSAEAVCRGIANHPEVQRDPSLLSNPAYLNSHPAYTGFLEAHPSIAAQARRTGSWDRNYQWRDPDWWHQNDPDWVYNNHPEWIQSHPLWMNDGDYDDTHHWRSRYWWMQNHPNWVKQHHPRWAEAHGFGADENQGKHRNNGKSSTGIRTRHGYCQTGNDWNCERRESASAGWPVDLTLDGRGPRLPHGRE